MKRLLKHAPAILLLLHLLPPAIIHLLEHSGYIVLRRNDAWWSWFLAALTAAAVLLTLIYRPEWNKTNRIAAVLLLPLGCILDFDFAAGKYMNACLPALICALFGIVLFIRSRVRAILKFPLALVSCLAVFLLLLGSVWRIGEINILSAVSPDEKHIAFVEFVDEGALGGRVLGYICEYHPDSPLDGYFRKGRKIIDQGFIYPDKISLYWEDALTINFNNARYHVE